MIDQTPPDQLHHPSSAPVSPPESEPYVFISYSRQNLAFVERLRADLDRNQVRYWIDSAGIPPGAPSWDQAIREAIRGAYAVIYVVSPISFNTDVIQGEIALAKMHRRVIFPVWAQGDNWLDCVPLDMMRVQYVDLREARYTTGFPVLLEALRGHRPDLALTTPPLIPLPEGKEPRNPYKGLRAFTENDRDDFFGRTQLIDTLVAMTSLAFDQGDSRLLAVIGPSGSGKSSVVMAGLLPRLRNHHHGHDGWVILPPFVPGVDPLENLSYALRNQLPPNHNRSIRKELSRPDSRGLHELAGLIVEGTTRRVLVFIDQFEELFTLVEDEQDRQQFINLLVTAATEPRGPVMIVLTLRADFYDRPMEYRHLHHLIESRHKSVLPLAINELYEAIASPAGLVDVQLEFEGELVGELAFDLLDFREPGKRAISLAGALPLLQFTLDRLFTLREGNRLTLKAYNEIGRVDGAVGSHADTVFKRLDETAQHALARVFYRLVNVDESGAATRKRARRVDVTGDDPAAESLVGALIDNRLLVTFEEDTIEVAHEALLRSWSRLADWIETTSEDLLWLQKVQADAAEWDRRERQDRLLWVYEDLYHVYSAIERLKIEVSPLVRQFIRPEIDRLLQDFRTAPEYRQLSIVDRLQDIGGDAARALVAALAYARADEVRRVIDRALWQIPKQAQQELIRALGQADSSLRHAAAGAITRLGVVEALNALLANIRDPQLTDIQPELVALTALRDPAAIPALVDLLEAQRESAVERAHGAEALGAIGHSDIQAVQALIQALKDQKLQVREAAASALGAIRHKTAVPPLIDAARDKVTQVRQAAATALGEIGDNRAFATLIRLTRDHHESVRVAAIRALGMLKTDKAEEALTQIAFSLRDPKPRVREAAAWTLARIGNRDAVNPLMETARNDDEPQVRRAAVLALQYFPGTGAINQVRKSAERDAAWQVRRAAIQTLGEFREEGAVDLLMNLLKDSRLELRQEAILTLGKLKAKITPAPLLEALKHRQWQIRHAAVQALSNLAIKEQAHTDALLKIARETDSEAAFAAVLVLASMEYSDSGTRRILHDSLKDPRPEIRAAGARALCVLRDQPALELLLVCLHDLDEDVRMAAAEAVGRIADETVLPRLKEALDYSYLGVRRAAVAALRVMDTPAARNTLKGYTIPI